MVRHRVRPSAAVSMQASTLKQDEAAPPVEEAGDRGGSCSSPIAAPHHNSARCPSYNADDATALTG